MSKIFSFPNLATPVGQTFTSLQACIDLASRMVAQRRDQIISMTKAQRRAWLMSNDSQWPCVSLVEGVNPHQRVSRDNPPHLLHGLTADFDAVGREFSEAEIAELVTKCAYPPAAGGPSLSGEGYHFVWLFKEPVQLLRNEGYARKIVETFFSKIRVGNLMVGLDEGCKRPTQLLSIDPVSFGWLSPQGEGCLVDEVSTRLWSSAVDSKFEFDNEGPALDLQKVKEQVEKLFPGRWGGPFEIGCRGIRFWDASAQDETAAVVTPWGMRYFSDGGGFKPWSAILGSDFTEKLSAENLKQITDAWFYDNARKEYVFYEKAADEYIPKTRTQILDRLEVAGLEDPVDRKKSLIYVEDFKRVAAVVALANQKRGLLRQGSLTLINTTKTKLIESAHGSFEFIDGLLHSMFPEEIQYNVLMTWLQDAHRSMVNLRPSYAQAVFLAGDVGMGKSLLQFRILTPLFGGMQADPMPYLLGDTSFNNELADAGHWIVSDAEGARTNSQRGQFVQKIKAVTANPSHSITAKYGTPMSLELNARTTFSFNKTMECIGLIPRLGQDSLDKVILLSVAQHEFLRDLKNDVIEARVAGELPAFSYWLLNDYQPPATVLSSRRYRTISYHHPDLLRHAMASQDNAELLNWIHLVFEHPDDGDKGKRVMEYSAAGWLRLINTVVGGKIELTQRQVASQFTGLSTQYPDTIKKQYDPLKRHYTFKIDYDDFCRGTEEPHV